MKFQYNIDRLKSSDKQLRLACYSPHEIAIPDSTPPVTGRYRFNKIKLLKFFYQIPMSVNEGRNYKNH